MAVACDHLCGRDRREPEVARTRTPRRAGRCSSTCRPRPRACRRRSPSRARARRSRSRRTCSAQSASFAPNVVGSAWMPCVRPTIGVSRNSCAPRGDRGVERGERRQQQVAGLDELPAQRGVDDVGRREAVVHPRAGGWPDAFLHDVDERGDVVVGDPLAFVHRFDVETRRAHGSPPRRRAGRRRGRPTPRRPGSPPRATPPNFASSVKRAAISGSE